MSIELKDSVFGGGQNFQDVGRIHYNGLMNIGDFFRFVRQWFKDRRYLFVEKTVKHKFGSGGLEKEYEWRASKKVNEYIKWEIRMVFKIKDIADVEVIRDGQKEKLSQVRMILQILSKFKQDIHGRFGKKQWGKNLKSIYHRFFVGKEQIVSWDDALEGEVKNLKNDINAFLEFEQTKG